MVGVRTERAALPGGALGEQRDRVRRSQRLQLVRVLAVDPERQLAGGQHPQAGRRPQQPGDHRCQHLHQVLAAVEHEQGPRAAQAVGDHRLGGLADAEGLAEAVPERGVRRGLLEPDQPAARRREPARGLDGQPGLADAGRSDQGHQAVLADQSGEHRDVVVATDQRLRDGGQVAACRSGPRIRCSGSEAAVVLEDLLLQRLQLRAGVEPELLGQVLPDAAVGGQRVRLPAGAVEHSDQQRPQPLAQRVFADQRLQVTDQLATGALVHARREVLLRQS